MLPPQVIAIFVFVFGLIIGSFLNVCISRLPQGKSVVLPASRCPKCQAPIKPYDNIPVISYLFLLGKCRSCKTRISPIYPAVELLTGILFLACFLVFGATVVAAKWAAFSAILVVLVFTDWRERLLPDKVNFTGLAIGLLFSFFVMPEDGTALSIANRIFDFPPPAPVLSLVDAIIGATVGGGILWLVGEVYFRLRGREGMGFGDVKMMLMAGAFLGLRRTILTILAGSLLGSLLGAVFILASRKGSNYELPFGTFLGVAALLVVFFGAPVVAWYQSLFMVR
ncbi:MAG TPA: prepilin peptidase [Candidatus Acidoferrales bacterium]|nr:prepilin peptidase [Candidatus Acidoferrales bacterium]